MIEIGYKKAKALGVAVTHFTDGDNNPSTYVFNIIEPVGGEWYGPEMTESIENKLLEIDPELDWDLENIMTVVSEEPYDWTSPSCLRT